MGAGEQPALSWQQPVRTPPARGHAGVIGWSTAGDAGFRTRGLICARASGVVCATDHHFLESGGLHSRRRRARHRSLSPRVCAQPDGGLVGGPVPCSSMVSGCLWLLLRSHISRCNPAGGLQWTQTFAWGTPDGPPTQKLAVGTNTGTLMVARLATGMSIVTASDLERQLAVWCSRDPGLVIRVL